jgi:hypothetical protein
MHLAVVPECIQANDISNGARILVQETEAMLGFEA